jgi:hypothetical protein
MLNNMSKVQKNYACLRNKTNSAKTAIARAEREVPHFSEHMAKFDEQVTLKSYSESTVFSYSRAIAQIAIYFKKSPLFLEPDEINRSQCTSKQHAYTTNEDPRHHHTKKQADFYRENSCSKHLKHQKKPLNPHRRNTTLPKAECNPE